MNFDWNQITHFRKVQVVSIEFTDDKVRYHIAHLKRVKDKVKVLSKLESLDSETIISQLNKNQPILIHVFGKGVLNRTAPPVEGFLDDVLMNAHPNDFYVNYLDIDQTRYVSFTRKDQLDEALKPIEELSDNILDICVGPYHTLIEEIKEKINSTPLGDIVMEEGVYTFQKPSTIQKLRYDGVYFNKSFYAVTLGAAFLQQNLPITVFNQEERKRKKSNFRDKIQFNYIGIGAIVFFLLALVSNYFYQGHINEKNADLESKIMVFSDNLKKIDLMDQEMQRKKQLIANSGIIRNNYFSTVLDQIGGSIPSTIQLEEIEVYPLEKKLKKNVKPVFRGKTIKIAGSTRSSENIDVWINTLNKLEWVDNVAILSFETDESKNIAFFELKIVQR